MGEGDCVDIGGCAEDVEDVVGAVEEEDGVVEGAGDAAVGCRVRGGRRRGGDVRAHGFHCGWRDW